MCVRVCVSMCACVCKYDVSTVLSFVPPTATNSELMTMSLIRFTTMDRIIYIIHNTYIHTRTYDYTSLFMYIMYAVCSAARALIKTCHVEYPISARVRTKFNLSIYNIVLCKIMYNPTRINYKCTRIMK